VYFFSREIFHVFRANITASRRVANPGTLLIIAFLTILSRVVVLVSFAVFTGTGSLTISFVVSPTHVPPLTVGGIMMGLLSGNPLLTALPNRPKTEKCVVVQVTVWIPVSTTQLGSALHIAPSQL